MVLKGLIKISIAEFNSKLSAFNDHRQRLVKFLDNLERVMNALATVSWVSPASKALLVKFRALAQTIRTALKIVEKYISDLETAIKVFSAAEQRMEQKVNSLKTDVFGI